MENIEIVRDALAEFQNGNPAGYMAIVDDGVKASMWSGFIHDRPIQNKVDFQAAMDRVASVIELSKFEPRDWASTGDIVYFTVGMEGRFKKPDGTWSKPIAFEGTVRKKMRNGKIVEKHHMIDTNLINQQITSS